MSVLECVGPVLAIQCKGKEAHLYLRDLASAVEKAQKGANGKNLVVDPCVAYEDQWVTPNRFVNVICGLKEARPSWKNAVYHSGVTMKKLLDDGTVTLKPLRCRCTECHKSSKSISSPSPKRKNNNNTKIGKKKVIEISTVFVCSVCDETFRTKKNFETHKKFAHLPPLVSRGQICVSLSPGRRDYALSYTTDSSPTSSEHDSSAVSSVQSQPINSRWSTKRHTEAPRKSEVRLTRLPTKRACVKEIVSSTCQDSTPTQRTPKQAHVKEISTSSPAQRKRARVTEVTSTIPDVTPEPPAAKRQPRTKPVAAVGIDGGSTILPKKAGPSVLAKEAGRLMIAANAFSGCSNGELLAELVERKACFPCTCGIVYTDRALFYLHKGMHDQTDPKKCGFCGYVSKDCYDFNSHFLDHRNPENDED